MKRRAVFLCTLAGLIGFYIVWPHATMIRRSLLADAQRDVFAFADAIPLSQLEHRRVIPVGRTVLLGDALRLRVVSDSHHNMIIGYSGSTYVNINNRVFFRDGGHCGPSWIMVWPEGTEPTAQTAIDALLEHGYTQVAGPE